jgi:hypothetical protein
MASYEPAVMFLTFSTQLYQWTWDMRHKVGNESVFLNADFDILGQYSRGLFYVKS